MEQPAVGGNQEVLWCNYNPDGTASISSSAHVPLQLDLSNSSIARQISQQMQVQYALNGQGQIVYQVPQNANNLQQVVVATAGQSTSSAAGTITPIVPQQVIEIPMAHALPEILPTKPNKARSGGSIERVQCPTCEKTFSCAANLRDHMRLHTGHKPFKCTECDMEFAQRSNWRLHRRVHTGEKPYMCGICGKTFARSSHLPSHMRIHTGEKPFKCELCQNCFPSSQALKNHTRTHTGEKPFTCLYCETSFTHSSSLSSHKKKCNGIKRKRGRPIGTGRKPTKKKQPSGRPRGRPKKKLRTGRGRKRLNPSSNDDSTGSIDPNSSLMDANNDSVDASNSVFIEKKFDVNVKIEKDINITGKEIETVICDEQLDPLRMTSPELDTRLKSGEDKTKHRTCQATDTEDLSSISKHPKVAIRESKRLRIKQETRKANMDALKSIKQEPEMHIAYEKSDGANESIIVDFDHSDEPFNNEAVVVEHEMSTLSRGSTFSSHDQACIQINIGTGTSVNSSSMIDQQKAAVTMASLQQQQEQQRHLQGVLNLTQHQPDLRNVQVVETSKIQEQPVITFINPLDLHQQNSQHLSTHNMHIVTPSIPLAHSTQNLSTIHKMNLREPYPQPVEHPQHSSEVGKRGIKEGSLQGHVSDEAPPTQYVSYQLGDSHVQVPVTLNRSINNLESNW